MSHRLIIATLVLSVLSFFSSPVRAGLTQTVISRTSASEEPVQPLMLPDPGQQPVIQSTQGLPAEPLTVRSTQVAPSEPLIIEPYQQNYQAGAVRTPDYGKSLNSPYIAPANRQSSGTIIEDFDRTYRKSMRIPERLGGGQAAVDRMDRDLLANETSWAKNNYHAKRSSP